MGSFQPTKLVILGHFDIGQCRDDALVERARWSERRCGAIDDLQRERWTALRQRDGDRAERRCGTVLDGERELVAIAVSAQVEILSPQAWNRARRRGSLVEQDDIRDWARCVIKALPDEATLSPHPAQFANISRQHIILAWQKRRHSKTLPR